LLLNQPDVVFGAKFSPFCEGKKMAQQNGQRICFKKQGKNSSDYERNFKNHHICTIGSSRES
jgi:hypothetical protein